MGDVDKASGLPLNLPLDEVFIEGLKVDAVIGVYDWERTITQPLLVDLSLYADQSKAAASDDIADAINYKKICEDVVETCQRSRANLIEKLAGDIANMVLANFATKKVVVTVRKPTAIEETQSVGVRIVRVAEDTMQA